MLIKSSKLLNRDERGTIAQILDLTRAKMQTVLHISSKAGAIRANHYHKKDIHYTFLLSGKFIYYEKSLKSKKLSKRTIIPGDIVISKSGIVHAMKFLVDSEMIVLTTESRNPKKYEHDTQRIKLI